MTAQATMFDELPPARPTDTEAELAAELDRWVGDTSNDPDGDSYWRRRRAEDRPKRKATLQFYAKMRRVAELIGYTCTIEDAGQAEAQRVELLEPGSAVRGYSARIDWRDSKKVRFHGLTRDVHDHISYDDPGNVEIGVSLSRPPEAMVKEIYSRLRQPYRELRGRAEQRKAAYESEGRRLAELIEQAKKAAGPSARGGVETRDRNQHDAKMSASGPGGYPAPGVEAEAHLYNGEHFTLKFDRIPPGLAMRLLQEFGEYIT